MVGMGVLSNSRLKRNFETNVRQIKSRLCAMYFENWIYFKLFWIMCVPISHFIFSPLNNKDHL